MEHANQQHSYLPSESGIRANSSAKTETASKSVDQNHLGEGDIAASTTRPYFSEMDRNASTHVHDTELISDNNPASIYDFLVKDMIPNDESIVEKGQSTTQTNFQKFSNGFSGEVSAERSSKREEFEGEYNDARTNDNNFFSYFQDVRLPTTNSVQQIGAIGEDRDSLMLKIMQNLHGNSDSSRSSQHENTDSKQSLRKPDIPIWNTFPTANHDSRPLGSASSTFTASSINVAASSPNGVHPGQSIGTKTMPAPLPAPSFLEGKAIQQCFASELHANLSPNNMNGYSPYMADSVNATKGYHNDRNFHAGSEPNVGQGSPVVTVGPRNAPGVGYSTQTVLSSYSFNLPHESTLHADAAGKQSSLSFPPLLVMEVAPSTLYLLHARPGPNMSVQTRAVGDFMASLHPTSAYTMKLIASNNSQTGACFNELQIAVLHCTFVINPGMRGFPGIDEINLPQKNQQMAQSSPYNAPSPYHVIQFRPLISQVTYIPLPEYLFDTHNSVFASSVPAHDAGCFNDYYSGNNILNNNIRINAPASYVKNTACSLFIGQTTYRTTPSVLYYIFNVICKIEILEVEVMRKQPCAFFYVYLKNESDMRQAINKLHKKILFDLHGVWYAQNDQEEEKLRKFVRSDREKMFPVLPLPKQCMVVERRNSLGGNPHMRGQPDMRANTRPLVSNAYLPHGSSMAEMGNPDAHMNAYHQPNMYAPGMHPPVPNSGNGSNNQPRGAYDSHPHYHQNMNFMPYHSEMLQYLPQGNYRIPPYNMPVPPMAPPPPAPNPQQYSQYPPVYPGATGKPADLASRHPILPHPVKLDPPMALHPPGNVQLAEKQPAQNSTKKRTFTLCVNTISTPSTQDNVNAD